jgi:Flp pilus assembly pilin Flp
MMEASNLNRFNRLLRKHSKGQGVIEYAGALVIAAVLVAAVLAIGPTQISATFTSIMGKVNTYFTSKLPT